MKTLAYLVALLRAAVLEILSDAVRWTLLRLCDIGLPLRQRADAAYLQAAIAHAQMQSHQRASGWRKLRRALRVDEPVQPWLPRRVDPAALRTAREQACADEGAPAQAGATVHPFPGGGEGGRA